MRQRVSLDLALTLCAARLYADRMSTISSPPAVGNHRERIAANVRAELARAQIKVSHLPRLVGGSYSYWSRRVLGELPFDTDHLDALAALVGVDPRVFLAVDDRSAGNIYFHGNESSHTGEAFRTIDPPLEGQLSLGIAS